MDDTTRLVGLEIGDDDAAWRAAGFTVEDGALTVGGVAISLLGSHGVRGLRSWSLQPPASGDCDGLPLRERPTARPAHGADVPAHPNGVTAIDHVVVASDDVERTTRELATVGCSPRRTTVGARGGGDEEIVYRFFLLGTCVLELVGPTRPRGDGPARFAGLAFTTGALDELGDLASPPRDAVQPGRRIATLRAEALGISVPTVFLSPRPRRDGAGSAGVPER